ncbi:MAG: TMEM175 family protein [Puia sp.]|nr:TMEM175 family protein [Puia sp.]
MVLELRVPHGDHISDLVPLWPVFLSYVLSFVYVGIYWNNHHHNALCRSKDQWVGIVGQPESAVLAFAGAVCDGLDGGEPF